MNHSIQDVADVTEDDLHDSARVIAWLESRLGFCGLPASKFLLARGIACAERAIVNGADPCRLFRTLIDRGLRDGWSFLSGEQIKAAEQRLAEINSRETAA